ncbi:hypothetical protein [Alkalilacustris brevis]|uniref:hypothetical protein n=1 Tax=Alkalilacustris brevis TaxID=2026338 RepID=UPI000E0CD698|nr:hypothetical protein [Alkalilacustris brevis]
MRLTPLLLGICALALAACATPRERCISDATQELRTIDALIAETRTNIERGYAIIREPDVRTRLVFCYNPPEEPFTFCSVDEPIVRERPVAIDRAEERRKLASLTERRAELLPQVRAELATCEARYPES